MPSAVRRIDLPDSTLLLVEQLAAREGWTLSYALGILVTEALRARGRRRVSDPVLTRGGRPKKGE